MCISFLSDDERVGCVLDVLHLHVEDGGQRFASRNRREYITTHAGMEKKGEEGRRKEKKGEENGACYMEVVGVVGGCACVCVICCVCLFPQTKPLHVHSLLFPKTLLYLVHSFHSSHSIPFLPRLPFTSSSAIRGA